MADKLANDYRVILVDRPGAGYSTRPEGAPATLTAQAKTIATLIRRLGLKQPLVVGPRAEPWSLPGAGHLVLPQAQAELV